MTQNSQYVRADEIVDKIHSVLGHFQGYRTLHAEGRLYRGFFKALPVARDYSRAVHLAGDEVPITVRFSKGGGDPFAHFNATVGMATRFYLPDGRITNLVMLSQKLFFARSVEQLLSLLAAAHPLEEGAPPNRAGLMEWFKTNANVAAVFAMRAAALAPISFSHSEFHAVHAFHLRNAVDEDTPVRFHWQPVGGVKGQPQADIATQDASILFVEMEQRLKDGPVSFDLVIELAEPGDILDDATALWAEGRKMVTIGRLTVVAPTTEAEIGDPVMNHDPTLLVDGIEASNDPILQIRRGTYEASAAQRTGGWRSRCPITPSGEIA